MKNKVKIAKRLLSILLVFLFSINSIAAVNDNDGTAFITKAEFDALKSSFQAQIDTYNQNIDSKIDTAIASYLSGIQVSTEPINYFDKYKSTTGTNLVFLNRIYDTGGAAQKCDLLINIVRKQSVNKYTNLHFNKSLWRRPSNGWVTLDAVLYFDHAPDWGGTYASWTTVWYRWQYSKQSKDAQSQRIGNSALSAYQYWNNATPRTSGISNYSATAQVKETGQGTAWIYQTFGNGDCIKYFADNIFVSYKADMTAHRYLDCASLTPKYYMEDNGKADTTTITSNIPKFTDFGTYAIGDTSPTINDTSNYTTGTLRINRNRTTDGTNYLNYIFADNTDTYLATLSENAQPIAADSPSPISPVETEYYDVYYMGRGGVKQTNKMSGVTSQYYPLIFAYEGRQVNEFILQSVSSVYGAPVYHGQGIPIGKITADTEKVKVKVTVDSSDTGAFSKIDWKLSDKPLKDNAFDSAATIKLTGTDVARNATIEKELTNVAKDTELWFNCYNQVYGSDAIITAVSIEKIV